MPTDALPETQSNPQQPTGRQGSSRARRWKRGLLTMGAVAAVAIAIAATFIPGAIPPRKSGPMLTHTVTRGDLLVSVIEQGMLESSNNAEIKCKVRGSNTVIWVLPHLAQTTPGSRSLTSRSSGAVRRCGRPHTWAVPPQHMSWRTISEESPL